MDLSSISTTRYTERAFNPQFYQQVPQSLPGASLNPPGASPLPGSNWPSDQAVWVNQSVETAGLEKIHVSELGERMLSRMEGQWEVQSWTVRRMQETQDSLERAVLAGSFVTRAAVNSLISMGERLGAAGRSVDIYA